MDFKSKRERRDGLMGSSLGWACALGLLALTAALPARSDWSDDFDGGFGADWNFAATDDEGDPPSTGTSTFAVVDAGADDYLLIAHSTKALRGGGGGAADGFAWVDETFTNVVISADVNAGPLQGQQSVLGLLGRGNLANGTVYFAVVDFSRSSFVIARSDDTIDFPIPLVIDDSVAIDPGTTYHIQFLLIGSSLTAHLRDASTGELLSTISVNDATYASGLAGIIVETAYDGADNPVAPIVGTFDSVEAVPEPALAQLLALGATALTAMGGRRRAGGER